MTTLGDAGEKLFLRKLLPGLVCSDDFVNGFGHDASIVDLGFDKNIVFKIDRAPNPVSVKNSWSDFCVWGRLAVVANVSDVLAVGGEAKAFMLSVIVPREMKISDLEDIISGCADACEEFGVSFVGGDTKEGSEVQVVGACIGVVSKEGYIGRKTAGVGDHLVVAGELGGFVGAYRYSKENSGGEYFADALKVMTNPVARISEGAYMSANCVASAACDLSDGLADALSHFCDETIGVTIREDYLPMHKFAVMTQKATRQDLYKLAFCVGDWAIAYVVTDEMYKKYIANAPSDLTLTSIGRFNGAGLKVVELSGGACVDAPGFINEHFRARLEDASDYFDYVK